MADDSAALYAKGIDANWQIYVPLAISKLFQITTWRLFGVKLLSKATMF